jgi:hypothetical protein
LIWLALALILLLHKSGCDGLCGRQVSPERSDLGVRLPSDTWQQTTCAKRATSFS